MSAAEALGLPPGVRFDPTGDELVEFYLLPRALGRPPAVPGIIIEDDAATSTSAQHPWNLLTRHRRTDDSEAYFFERVAGSSDDATKGRGAGARQDRSCGGRWTWVGQKRAPDEALPLRGDGEHVPCSWGKYSLNLQEGRRKGGSTGWVMHEYTISSASQCPLLPVKLCHVSFTGHGQKRQRVPDDDGEGEGQVLGPQAATQPPHKRAATGSCTVSTATAAMPNQEFSEAYEQNQEQWLPIYNSSPSGHFWSSDAGLIQESSIILDPPYPAVRSNHQEPFAFDHLNRNQESSATQSQAYHHQEQFGSSQEPQAWNPLIEAEQFSLAQLLDTISSPLCPPTTPAAYHEEQQIHKFSCTTEQSHGDTDQVDDFFTGFGGDLDSFCDTSGIQDDDDMAAQTLAAGGCRGGMSWDRHFFYQQPAL